MRAEHDMPFESREGGGLYLSSSGEGRPGGAENKSLKRCDLLTPSVTDASTALRAQQRAASRELGRGSRSACVFGIRSQNNTKVASEKAQKRSTGRQDAI